MKEQLLSILKYLETESYLMAFRTLAVIEAEYEDPEDWLSLETKTDLDVLHTCLSIVVGERAGHPATVRSHAQTSGFYERLAWLLTKKLLGDEASAKEVDLLMICEEALRKARRN